jgi:uncharacterized protein YyaL (SSP411 family)
MSEPHLRKPLPPPEVIAGLPPDGGPDYNRLVFSQSPYLLQHAANPVDWFPWGDDAFHAARTQDKPIFLSIGYSTCHWCHVMERESFEDEEVARLMNRHFIPVKVDREERPDVDKIYMDVTQAMTGHGGWPMTVILTPDRKPFFAGTYFPKQGSFGRPGMMDLIPQIADAWTNQRDRVEAGAAQITDHLQSMNQGSPGPNLNAATLRKAYDQLSERYDAKYGGFGSAPKFPTPHQLTFLLRYGQRTGSSQARDMVAKTLTEMRLGGMYDHIGFGFHRYSTDRRWLLPHFEKMLYDQALIAIACLEAYQATGRDLFAQTAREIFTYVLRDMTSPEGGFYSAEDADSEGEEGKFYVWSMDELQAVLGPGDAAFFAEVFQCKPDGNFAHETGGHNLTDNIPHLRQTVPDLSESLDTPVAVLTARLESIRERLFQHREQRVHPFKDDKLLTDWNGLMMAALALGADVLDESAYREASVRCADFILTTLRDQRGRLVKRYRQGQAGLPGHLEDYAFVVWGLLNLYESTFDVRYLREAIGLTDQMIRHFWDPGPGGFFLSADDGEALLVRGKEIYDGAIPSGNSVAAVNLLRLARMTGNSDYEDKALAVVRAFSGAVSNYPAGFTHLLGAVDFALGPSLEIVIASSDAAVADRFLRTIRSPFAPNKVVLLRTSAQQRDLASVAEYTDAMTPVDEQPTAYVCRNFACEQPTTDPAALRRALHSPRE